MSGKTNRKHRRNKEFCEAYKKSGRREINKAIKIERHLAVHPSDTAKHSGAVCYTRKKPRIGLDKYLFNNNIVSGQYK